MKSHAHPGTWTRRVWSGDGIAVDTNIPARWETSSNSSVYASDVHQPKPGAGLSSPMRIVGVLAFCQAILFLVLFLFLCAHAGAATATASKSTSSLELTISTYSAQTTRDPFGSEIPKADNGSVAPIRAVAAGNFKLGGILYDAVNPAALVNDQLAELNKPVKVQTAQGEVEIKAVTITRTLVVLDVGGQKVELQFGGGEHDGKKDSK